MMTMMYHQEQLLGLLWVSFLLYYSSAVWYWCWCGTILSVKKTLMHQKEKMNLTLAKAAQAQTTNPRSHSARRGEAIKQIANLKNETAMELQLSLQTQSISTTHCTMTILTMTMLRKVLVTLMVALTRLIRLKRPRHLSNYRDLYCTYVCIIVDLQ